MMLTLTLMNKENNLNRDIQVNSEQKMIDTLDILKEAGMLSQLDKKLIKVKSVRKGMYIDVKNTYEEEYINTGDVLELI